MNRRLWVQIPLGNSEILSKNSSKNIAMTITIKRQVIFFSKYHGQPCFLLIFLDTIMPERSIRVHETDRPWMSSQLKGFISRRQRAFTHGNELLFKMLRNKVNRERKGCRKVH